MRLRNWTFPAFLSASVACGPSLDLLRLTAPWGNEQYGAILIQYASDRSTLLSEVVSPGAAISIEVAENEDARVWALAFDPADGEELERCGVSLDGDGLRVSAKSVWAARIDTRDPSSFGTFERATALPFELRYDRCRPTTLDGIWSGVTTISYHLLTVRVPSLAAFKEISGFTTGDVMLDAASASIPIPEEFRDCVHDFSVTATRTRGIFEGLYEGGCPGPSCFRGKLSGSVTETHIEGVFQTEEGICASAHGSMVFEHR